MIGVTGQRSPGSDLGTHAGADRGTDAADYNLLGGRGNRGAKLIADPGGAPISPAPFSVDPGDSLSTTATKVDGSLEASLSSGQGFVQTDTLFIRV